MSLMAATTKLRGTDYNRKIGRIMECRSTKQKESQ